MEKEYPRYHRKVLKSIRLSDSDAMQLEHLQSSYPAERSSTVLVYMHVEVAKLAKMKQRLNVR